MSDLHDTVKALEERAWLLEDLVADVQRGERHIVTHGGYRQLMVDRNEAVLEAFDRQA